MKISVIDYPNLKQEVKVGDKVLVEGYDAEILEIREPDEIKLKYKKVNLERIEVWNKECISVLMSKLE